MIMGIAALVYIPLLAVSIAFTLWALGRTWPLKDKQLLAQSVNGRPCRTGLPSRWLFALVAVFFWAAGFVLLSLADPTAGKPWLDMVGGALGLLFAARGIAGYMPRWRAAFPVEPFATLDRKTYSPLALYLGAGFLLLVLLRLP